MNESAYAAHEARRRLASEGRAAGLESAIRSVLARIGNVDHSRGHGENAARLRGELLNDIRRHLSEVLGEDAT